MNGPPALPPGPSISNVASDWNGGVWTVTAVSTIIFALRIVPRLQLKLAGLDDLAMSIAWAVAFTASVVFSVSISASTSISPTNAATQLPYAVKVDLIDNSLGIMAVAIPKLAVALLLVRVLEPKRLNSAILILLGVLIIILAVILVIIEYVQCDPIPGQWNPIKYPNVKCWNPKVQIDFSITVAAISAFLDFFYAIYPITVFTRLQMSTSRKVGVSILMGLGIIAGCFAIYKATLFHFLYDRAAGPLALLYQGTRLALWTLIEAHLIIIAGCLPTLLPSLRAIRMSGSSYFTPIRSMFSSRSRKSQKYKDISEDNVGSTELVGPSKDYAGSRSRDYDSPQRYGNSMV